MALTGSEKQELARKISKGVQVVSSSIAQLHLTSPDPNANPYSDDSGIIQSLREFGEGKWKFTQIEGALLLTKDPQGICHFRIYDLGEYKLRFQYELYENLDYQKLSERVHAFEMESCVCGFTFSSVAVAEKFFSRVQNNITRNSNPGMGMMSPTSGFNSTQRGAPPPIPKKNRRATNKKLQNQKSPMQKSFNGSKEKSFRKKTATQNVMMQNGAIDPNNVPKAWKRILKKAGIRKKDLRNPQMFEVIRDALAQHNIELSPPDEIDYDDAALKAQYPPDQLEAWKKYQAEMKKYEEDKARYEREMAEYESQMAQEQKLQRLMQEQGISFGGNPGGVSGTERIRASVMKFQGKDMGAQAVIPTQQARQMPRMSVARPNLPNLPAVAAPKRNPIQHLMDKRASKVVIKAGFLADIKNKPQKLKRVSVLPEIRNLGKDTEGGLLAAIKKKMQENRMQLTGGESDDEDNFSTFSDE